MHVDDVSFNSLNSTQIPHSLECKWLKEAEQSLPAYPRNVRVIKQQLWCCCGLDGIIVFDPDLRKQRTISADSIRLDIHDVTETSWGDVIVAADKGLYRQQGNGKNA